MKKLLDFPIPLPASPLKGEEVRPLPFKGKVACDVCDWGVGEGMECL